MFKHEECPGHNKLTRLIQFREKKLNRKYSIFVGNGGLYVPQELRRGADGIMTGFAFIEMLVKVYNLFVSNSKDSSEDIFDIFLLIKAKDFKILKSIIFENLTKSLIVHM